MIYLSLKTAHLLSMVILFGTGLGTAWYKWMADRTGDVNHIAVTNRMVVFADWLFTTPAVIIQPLTGALLVHYLHIPWDSDWLLAAYSLYAIAGICWLPVVWIQIQMRDLSSHAQKHNKALPDQYWRYARIWFYLGIPAFIAMILLVILMVFKPHFS
jgi:uncharacterized membrane protein